MARRRRFLMGVAVAGLCLALLQGCVGGSADWYKAQLEAMDKRKPIFELKAKPGEKITLGGVESLIVWGDGANTSLAPYQDPWAPVVREGLGILGMGASLYLSGTQVVELADAVGRNAGTHISGGISSDGQSGLIYAPGAGGDITSAPQANPTTETTTTTTTDDHRGQEVTE